MGFYEAAIAFALGGAIYVMIELIYRGRTHVSMFFAGGAAFMLMHGVFEKQCLGIVLSCLAGALIITAVEFAAGYVVNIKLRLGVWDYTSRRGNLYGQICPRYFLMWLFLSLPAMLLSGLLSGALRAFAI